MRTFSIGETEPIYAAMDNRELWMTSELREKLSNLSWSSPDERHDMMAPNVFKGKLRELREKHPRLFKDEDAEPPLPSAPLSSGTSKEPKPIWVDEILDRVETLQAHVDLWTDRVSQPVKRETEPTPVSQPKKSILGSIPWWLWLTVGLLCGEIYRKIIAF